MLIRIHPETPDPRQVKKVVEVLKDGGVIIYPTDGVYAFGCDIYKSKAVSRIGQLKGIKPEKANFSFVLDELSRIMDFSRPVDTPVYKLLKTCLPGPYTFILSANNQVPKLFKNNKRTIGIRIPDNKIPRDIVTGLGNPIMTASVHDEDEILEYSTDPELIHERYKDRVDLVVDGGYGALIPSTVIDCSSGYPQLIRQGAGEVDID